MERRDHEHAATAPRDHRAGLSRWILARENVSGGIPGRRKRRTTHSRPPKARRISTWILRRPDTLDQDEHAHLADIRTRCPDLDRLATHVTEFAKILTTAVEADDQPDLHSFATGLKRDWDAVIAGLTTPHNSGAVEGNVNRIK